MSLLVALVGGFCVGRGISLAGKNTNLREAALLMNIGLVLIVLSIFIP